jgi:hypothetical protein
MEGADVNSERLRCAALGVQLLGLLALFPAIAIAQKSPSASEKTDVTILYDATLHEFVCWGEGRPSDAAVAGRIATARASYEAAPSACDSAPPSSHFYPYKDNLYFFDNQQVWIQLIRAHVSDLFTAQAAGTSLTEPTIPIFGGTTTVPTFASLATAATSVVAAGAGAPAAVAPRVGAPAVSPGLGVPLVGVAPPAPAPAPVPAPAPAPAAPPPPPQPQVFLYAGDELFADLDSKDPAAFSSDLQQLVLAFNQPASAAGSGSTTPSAPPVKTTTTSQGSATTTTTTIGAADASTSHAGGHAIPGQLPVQILSPSVVSAINYFKGAGGVITALDDQVNHLRDGLAALHFGTSCGAPPPIVDPLTLLTGIARLQRIVDSENALYQQLTASQYLTASQTLSTAAALLGSAVLPGSVTAQADSFEAFQRASSLLSGAGIDAVIDSVVGTTQHYTSGDGRLTGLLHEVNRWSAGDGKPEYLRANLKYLVAQLANLEGIEAAFDSLRATAEDLQSDGPAAGASALNRSIAIQNELNDLGQKTIAAALFANCSIENAPLPDPYDYFSLGTWYSSQTVPVNLQQTTRVPVFNLSTVNANAVSGASASQTTSPAQPGAAAGSGSGGASAAAASSAAGGGSSTPGSGGSASGGQSPSSSASSGAGSAAAPAVARQTTFSVHARYRWILGAGFVYGYVPHDSYTILTAQTPPSGQTPGPSCASSGTCLYVTQTKARQQVLPTLDLIYLLTPQDPFPHSFRGFEEPEPRVACGLMVGFDLASPGNDFLIGLATMVRAGHGSVLNGIGFKVALLIGKESQVPPLPAGVTINTFFNPPNPNTIAVPQVWRPGLVVGATISADAFESFFGSIFK